MVIVAAKSDLSDISYGSDGRTNKANQLGGDELLLFRAGLFVRVVVCGGSEGSGVCGG